MGVSFFLTGGSSGRLQVWVGVGKLDPLFARPRQSMESDPSNEGGRRFGVGAGRHCGTAIWA